MSADRRAGPRRGQRFLERRSYRRHRLEDAAKLLPVLGAFLVFGPVGIHTTQGGIGGGTAGWLVYFLAVWFGLILISAALARALQRPAPPDSGESGDRGG